jgi:twinkle protein
LAEDSEFVEHIPCEKCGSSDANSLYTDGHQYCHACTAYVAGDGDGAVTAPAGKRASGLINGGEFVALAKRGISEETCKKWGYRVAEFKGGKVQVADYRGPAGGATVGQKVRFPNKDFTFLGNIKEAGLYGQHLWRDKGKRVVITEGEIDALTVSQLQDNKWPVVSVPNGAQGAKKALAKALDWLAGFEEVVLFFDDDEPGRAAVEECAPLFPPGRCKVARMEGFKDPNEAHQAKQGGKVIDAIWGAKTYRPDGILNGTDLWEALTTDDTVETASYPWETLNEKLRGLRKGELTLFTSGSGMGKSAVVREVAHHLLREGETVGMLMLEESTKRTAKGLMGIELSEPIHLDMTPWADLTAEQQAARRQAYEATVGSGRLFLYDHFGSTDLDNLMARLRFLAKGCGCGWIFLDHLSIVVSGLDDGDERKTIDLIMTKIRTFVQETGVGFIMVSHLKRPQGDRGHEQGAEVSLAQLRGSHSIAQLSDCVIGLERNQQDEQTKNLTTVRILKDRFSGESGIACHLLFDKVTGRLSECRPEFVGASMDEESPF